MANRRIRREVGGYGMANTRSRGGRNIVDVRVGPTEELEMILERIEMKIRLQACKKAVSAAARLVARRAKALCPKPGYDGDKTDKDPSLTPLRETITYVVRIRHKGVYAYVGPEYKPKGGGNHGHLVEFGHRIVRGKKKGKQQELVERMDDEGNISSKWEDINPNRPEGWVSHTRPKPFMRLAALETQAAQEAVIIAKLAEALGP